MTLSAFWFPQIPHRTLIISQCLTGMLCPFLQTRLADDKKMVFLASEAQLCRHLPFLGQWEVTRKSGWLFISCFHCPCV